MTLREKRVLLTNLACSLVARANALGYEAAFGEVFRTNEQAAINAIGAAGREQLAVMIASRFPALSAAIRDNGRAGGIRLSLHQYGLAVDLNLYRDGRYLDSTEDHRPLGEWWEKQHALARWGGRFGDGNHYSIEHEGVK